MMIVRNIRDYQNCSVLWCVRQLCTVIHKRIWAVLKVDCLSGFRFSSDLGLHSVCFFLILFLRCFCFYCVHLPVLHQEIGWGERLRNDLMLCRAGRKTLRYVTYLNSAIVLYVTNWNLFSGTAFVFNHISLWCSASSLCKFRSCYNKCLKLFFGTKTKDFTQNWTPKLWHCVCKWQFQFAL